MANLTVNMTIGEEKIATVLGTPFPNTGVLNVGYSFYPAAIVTCAAGDDANHFKITGVGNGTTVITVVGTNASGGALPNDTITVTISNSLPAATELGTTVS